MVEHATTYTVRKLLESLDVDHEDEEGGLDVVFDPNDVCEGGYCWVNLFWSFPAPNDSFDVVVFLLLFVYFYLLKG